MKLTNAKIKAKVRELQKEQARELYEEKVKRYYTMGLTYCEIAKLLDVSSRTIQRHITATELKKEINEPTNLQKKAFELSAKGFSYSEIAERLNVTKTTVYMWHRKQKQATTAEK